MGDVNAQGDRPVDVSSGIELYSGLWFPLGINNVIELGQKLTKYRHMLQNAQSPQEPQSCYLDSKDPTRAGNVVLWNCWLAVERKHDYILKLDLRWQGNGYVLGKGVLYVRQDGEFVEDPSAGLVRSAFRVLEDFLIDIVAHCLLEHQQNYAENIIFGFGLSDVLRDFEPTDVSLSPETKTRIAKLKLGNSTTTASPKQLKDGLKYLSYKLLVFQSLNGLVLNLYDHDFKGIDGDITYQNPLPSGKTYVKGIYNPAYDISIPGKGADESNQIEPRYLEKRGTIAISRSALAKDTNLFTTLLDLLICLNTGLQFGSLMAYELSDIRRNTIKARRWLGKKDELSDNEEMAEYVIFLQSKFPLFHELIDFMKFDLKKSTDRLLEAVNDIWQELIQEDPYLADYPPLLQSSLDTQERLVNGLARELTTLNDYIVFQVQQKGVRLARESQTASTQALDTQLTLTEIQRSTVLKGRKTKFLAPVSIAIVIAGTGIWSGFSASVWNFVANFWIYLTSLLGVSLSSPPDPATIPIVWEGAMRIIGVLGVSLLGGWLILALEKDISDIAQKTFEFDDFVGLLDLADLRSFFREVAASSFRDSETQTKVRWTTDIPIFLKLDAEGGGDKFIPSNIVMAPFFKLRTKRYIKKHGYIRSENRPCVCALEYVTISDQSKKQDRIRLQSLTITVDRASNESLDAYIYPIYLYGYQIMLKLLGEANKPYILGKVKRATADKYYRGGTETIGDSQDSQ